MQFPIDEMVVGNININYFLFEIFPLKFKGILGLEVISNLYNRVPWRWLQRIPSEFCYMSTKLHYITSQKTVTLPPGIITVSVSTIKLKMLDKSYATSLTNICNMWFSGSLIFFHLTFSPIGSCSHNMSTVVSAVRRTWLAFTWIMSVEHEIGFWGQQYLCRNCE